MTQVNSHLDHLIGQHDARLAHVEKMTEELRVDIRALLNLAAEINGGKKIVLGIAAAIGAVAGAVLAWLLSR